MKIEIFIQKERPVIRQWFAFKVNLSQNQDRKQTAAAQSKSIDGKVRTSTLNRYRKLWHIQNALTLSIL